MGDLPTFPITHSPLFPHSGYPGGQSPLGPFLLLASGYFLGNLNASYVDLSAFISFQLFFDMISSSRTFPGLSLMIKAPTLKSLCNSFEWYTGSVTQTAAPPPRPRPKPPYPPQGSRDVAYYRVGGCFSQSRGKGRLPLPLHAASTLTQSQSLPRNTRWARR